MRERKDGEKDREGERERERKVENYLNFSGSKRMYKCTVLFWWC